MANSTHRSIRAFPPFVATNLLPRRCPIVIFLPLCYISAAPGLRAWSSPNGSARARWCSAEMATRHAGVFGHRLYAGVRVSHVDGGDGAADPNQKQMTRGCFGSTAKDLPILAAQRPPPQPTGIGPLLRSAASFGTNLVGCRCGTRADTADFEGDVDGWRHGHPEPNRLDDDQLRAISRPGP